MTPRDRPPIVLLHGLWCGPWVWTPLLHALRSRGFPCFAPDLSPSGALTRREESDRALRSTWDELGDETPIVIGHSHGAWSAQLLAARGLAREILLISPTLPRQLRTRYVRAVSQLDRARAWMRPSTRSRGVVPCRSVAMERLTNSQDAESRRHILERLRPAARWTYADVNVPPRFPVDAVPPPLLVIAGSDDRMTLPRSVRRLVRHYRCGERYVELPGADHFPMFGASAPALQDAVVDALGTSPGGAVDA